MEMGSMERKIGYDLKEFAAKTALSFLKEVSGMQNGEGVVAELEVFVSRLEEERRKIEAFKGELPFCMHLLNDVIEAFKKELEQCGGMRYTRIFGELVPLRFRFEERAVNLETDGKEKMNWMSSAQPWSENSCKRYCESDTVKEEVGGELNHIWNQENLFSESKSPIDSAFVPFIGVSSSEDASAMAKTHALPALSGDSASIGTSRASDLDPALVPGPPRRKARRCWSPELHTRFLFALEQLGGVQVATPKQIRELMKVDDLSNDEVKSHLQKHRLYVRRAPKSSDSVEQSVEVAGTESFF